MKLKSSSRRKRNNTKSILRLPDLEHAKVAVLNSLNSADAKRGYRHAIDEFVDWYCSELAWPSTESWACAIALISNPVTRPRNHQSAPWAVRRPAYEAADCGLLCAGFDQPSMIALASSLILELGAGLCRRSRSYCVVARIECLGATSAGALLFKATWPTSPKAV